MQRTHPVDTPLRHAETRRSAAVLRVDSFWETAPVSITDGRYVLVVASERLAALSSTETARAWVEAGASYICAWGPDSREVEDTFDYASFLPEFGDPLSFTLMTTSHPDEALDEALWFAFHNATAPDDLGETLNSVVIVVDSDSLASRCLAWVQGLHTAS